MPVRDWVNVDGIEYRVTKIECDRSRGLYITMILVNSHPNDIGDENREYVLRFTPLNYSWILDDSLVTNVSFSTNIKLRLIRRDCVKWFWESLISEKENKPPPGGPSLIN